MPDKDERKEALKEAMREWLDDEKSKVYRTVGVWFLSTIAVAVALGVAYLILISNGWKHSLN